MRVNSKQATKRMVAKHTYTQSTKVLWRCIDWLLLFSGLGYVYIDQCGGYDKCGRMASVACEVTGPTEKWKWFILITLWSWESILESVINLAQEFQNVSLKVSRKRYQVGWNSLHVWRRGVMVSGVRRMNEVNARRARLVAGWGTLFGRV